MRQDGFAPGTRVSTDQALDVDSGLGLEQHERVEPVCVMHPMLDSKLLLGRSFTAAHGDILNHFHLCGSKRLGLVKKACHSRRVSIGLDEGVERLHQVPHGTVDLCLKAGVNIVFGTASPPLSTGNEFELNYTFGA